MLTKNTSQCWLSIFNSITKTPFIFKYFSEKNNEAELREESINNPNELIYTIKSSNIIKGHCTAKGTQSYAKRNPKGKLRFALINF